ncbi:heavy metal translocatin [Phialemonium atrogriseum]|uniref:Heavy metal translocatin n=1 Tax=Phialemonium atrogriseum TaxID=1093897 RepID=A0AAJ0FR21_9PEZI|nr:heavy metal translocatin [Phialemonium atrogriseum]KAK1771853.1 heavy metal translocatin [Phialemonium atrogriseum]
MAASHTSARRPGFEFATTSFLLGNLHCPTCVSTIQTVIKESCAGQIRWVSPNVVTSVVTVEHSTDASIKTMQKVLEESGFEVCGVTTSAGGDSDLVELEPIYDRSNGDGVDDAARPTSAFSRWRSYPRNVARSQTTRSSLARTHLQNCEQCRNSVAGHATEKASETTLVSQPSSSSMSNRTVSSGGPVKKSSKSFITVETDDASVSLPTWRAAVAIGGMTCAACANTVTEELNKRDWISKVAVNLVTNSATVELNDKQKVGDLVEAIEDLGFEATLDSVVSVSQENAVARENQDSWRATLAIGGMTCASCVNTINEELKKKDWISDFAINLVSNSATVEFRDKKNVARLVETIEDLGYEATIDTVVSAAPQSSQDHERTVEILLEGLYCEHCPARVANSLVGFRRQLEVLHQPTLPRPIIKVSYTPDAPRFTVRQILAAIEASDPALKASIYHPPTLEERSKQIQRKHQRALLYRVIFTGITCIPTFILGIVYMSLLPSSNRSKEFLMKPWTSGISRAQMALLIMATPVYFFAADVFHVRAFKEIKNLWRRGSRVPILRRFYRFGSMNTLMSLGTTIAYISSVSQIIAAAVYQPDEVNDSNFYFDSVVFLTFFLLVGRLIESYSKSKTGDAVEMLGKLRPTTAILVERHGSEKERDSVVKVDMLDFGDIVRITHGGSPPADGTVVRGESNFDESSLTGESRLVKKAPGDEVFAGTVNKGSPLLIQITGAAGQSMLDQIVKVVREGQTKRAPMERVADLLTTYFVPVVTLVAILTWILWMSLGFGKVIPSHFLDVTSGGWVAFSLQFAISVFVVACPCGLALAAPTAIFVGGGMAAKYGILAKGGGEAFEKASHIDCVVFDKTGTLTEGGEPSITDSDVCPDSDGVPEKKRAGVLAALRAVEENSSHPIAKAIVSFCTSQTADRAEAEDMHEIPGKGMKAAFRGVLEEPFELIVGNEALMQDYDVAISPKVAEALQKWKTEAKSVALVATRLITASDTEEEEVWTLAAILSISDPIRPEAPAVIRALQGRGTRVWMLSGDNPTTAAAVGKQLGIPLDQIIAGVLPTEKAAKITYLQSTLKAREGGNAESVTQRAMVAMVGDGINDSPALATADVGIAIGSGSDVAISSADFVLVKSDLKSVVTLLDLSSTVFRRIKFNFGWALIYNILAVPVAAGALYPIVSNGKHVRLDPVWASLAMALSSISVVMSSLALRSGWPILGFRERKVD